ncbi:transporter [Erwinia mallotivora]|uniref:transporter n=1 Tax=Erwinia mallotivora TaxID=69222 RepID=UPI0021C0B48C|nr:transporter [Erwinia mallotivora]
MMQGLRFFLPAMLLCSASVRAVEVAPGDYSQFPDGTTVGLLYYQHASTGSAWAEGKKVGTDYRINSDIGMLRLLHTVQISDTATLDPQFLLPFGHLASGGNADALGSASGTGDLILTVPLKIRLNASGDLFGFAPYLSLPTGSYDHNQALNLGENRWKVDLQAAWVKSLSEKWALEMVGDAIWYGDNNDYGPGSGRLQQDNAWTAQLMGRYMPDPTLSLGAGVGQSWGGSSTLDGNRQSGDVRTSNVRLTATKFFTPRDQVQIQLGRDLRVENGAAEDFRLNLRYARVF